MNEPLTDTEPQMERSPETVTLARQRLASDPARSVWVSANAGSGKTTVLVDRVIRLLLDGVEPTRILCLTYTKAAAANMATRVFEKLSGWVLLDDAALDRRIEAVTGARPDRSTRVLARQLFARAIETPGGLKVQTIHAFCERVLQMFPFEANVPARFAVLDDATAQAMRERAIADLACDTGDDLIALRTVALQADEDGFDALLKEALQKRVFLRDALRTPDDRHRASLRLRRALGLEPTDTRETILNVYGSGGLWLGDWRDIAAVLATSKGIYDTACLALLTMVGEAAASERHVAARRLFSTDGGTIRADTRLMSEKLQKANEAAWTMLSAEKTRFFQLEDRLRAIAAWERSAPLYRCLASVHAHYQRSKRAQGALDFDDLIERTASLFSRSDAQWVLYKLDMSVAHVLVDEAQDTSAAQWAIFEALTGEFSAGAGAGPSGRTIFVVGDEKQSIYGFQGAEPKLFSQQQTDVRRRVEQAQLPFDAVSLDVSFRSTPDVLAAVDRVFADPAHHDGLVFGDRGMPPHEASSKNASRPGFVELWPYERKIAVDRVDDEWERSDDEIDADAPVVRLAQRIATAIARMIDVGDPTGRPVSPGDIMVLLQRRNPLFHAIIAALKRANVPISGADRLVLSDHIAVQDLVSLGRAVATRDDDLALAETLLSPLIGLDDLDLRALAAGRAGSLAAMLDVASGHTANDDSANADPTSAPRTRHAGEQIARWRIDASRLGPYGFFSAVLERDGGRRALLARLGQEAADAIDEFMSRALEFEQTCGPSIRRFLAAFEGERIEIKRDLARGAPEIRVMTVHAAKGLEAPIVFIPDALGMPSSKHDPKLLEIADPDASPRPDGTRSALLVWSPGKLDCAEQAKARENAKAEAMREYRRQLYVAMTRAQNGLIVCGQTGRTKLETGWEKSWYGMVRAAMDTPAPNERVALEREEIVVIDRPEDLGGEAIFRWRAARTRTLSGHAESDDSPDAARAHDEPDWLFRAAAGEMPTQPPLRPSSILDAADRLDRAVDGFEAAATARARGTLVHRLLEHLAGVDPTRRDAVATLIVKASSPALDPDIIAAVLADVARVLDDPRLAPVFGPGSRAEAMISGHLTRSDGVAVTASARIDRLVVTPERVVIVDYKTGPRPAMLGLANVALVRATAQLAAYRALVAPLFANRPIACWLVWTTGPAVYEVPAAVLDEALVMAGLQPGRLGAPGSLDPSRPPS